MSSKRVCVVGAGVSGLVTIKECRHAGLDPVCYELNSDLGGVWTNDRGAETSNTPRTWDHLITNTSKYMMTFSDFHATPDTPQYFTRDALSEYYRSYAKHFELNKHIRYNTRVVKIKKTSNHNATGQWEVYTCPTSEFHGGDRRAGLAVFNDDLNRCCKEIFDVVLVCTGFFKTPNYPDIPGLSSFPGTVQHSFDYKSPVPFQDKKVLVVGNSFSACDIACDISMYTGKAVELSVGKGTWILPRVMPGGVAFDRCVTRHMLFDIGSDNLNKILVEMCQSRLDHFGSGINSPTFPFRGPFMMGDDIYMKILADKIRIKDRLVRFVGSSAEFKDGSKSDDLDAVVLSTGYSLDTSFLDLKIMHDEEKMELYNMMLPIREEHPTLAFIGFLSGNSAVAPAAELQARYMVRLITGKISAPSKQAREQNIQLLNQMSFELKGNYSYFLPMFVLSDMIAKDIGAYPCFWRILFRDPVLAFRLWYGPIFSAQFRLLGPDSDWNAARATCYRGMEVLSAIPSTRGSVQMVRAGSSAGKGRRVLILACGVSVLVLLGYAGHTRNWLQGWRSICKTV